MLPVILVVALLAAPPVAETQPAAKAPRIGLIHTGSLEAPEVRRVIDAFRQGLRELGYVEGQNLVIEYRGAEERFERLPTLAAEMVRLKVDVIVSPSSAVARAIQQATTTIPVVVSVMQDPVGDGLVANLAKPGGNITGLTTLGPELVPKRLSLLKEVLPKASRVAALWHPGAFGEDTARDMLRETELAARTLGVKLQLSSVKAPEGLDRAFSAIAALRADALLVFPGPMLFSQRKRIIDFTSGHRLPSMFPARENVEDGGLMSYGPSIADLVRRSATFVDKILKGARPAELPVEQPTKFELVINLKTAKAIGLTIPPSALARADEVIQ
jgi:putative ABC transport system substrate-binding protein